MELIWLIIVISAIIIEALTFNLVTIWIAIGGLFAYISTFITDVENIQIVVFLLVTIISLISTRKFVKYFINKDKVKTNLDDVEGRYGIVTDKIKDDEIGRVKVMGKSWSAKSDDEKTIEEGKKIKVIKIEGVKLIVKEEK